MKSRRSPENASGEGSGHPRHRPLFVWDAEAGEFAWTGIRPRCADAILKQGWDLGIDLTAAQEPSESDALAGQSKG